MFLTSYNVENKNIIHHIKKLIIRIPDLLDYAIFNIFRQPFKSSPIDIITTAYLLVIW